ncbi:MAG: hypothetical protein JOZ78_00915 [Chroococcidiopsidaceae cyanobacterium CP_BM_ER_R8_30]|nr:hypothetical protein [Chroococcidiopsidaceae cyanobacterium CP_BM_ER_R8_30]
MQLHELDTDLLHQLSEQEQEVVAGGVDGNTINSIYQQNKSNLQGFLTGTFTYLGSQSGVLYNNFDYSGFFNNLQQSGYLDSSSPGGSNSTVPQSFGAFGGY